MKSYTDIEQSKKLAEILPIESADMFWMHVEEKSPKIDFWKVETIQRNFKPYSMDIPCWSLAALLDVLPSVIKRNDKRMFLTLEKAGAYNLYYKSPDRLDELWETKEEPIDSCYQMILILHEFGLLKMPSPKGLAIEVTEDNNPYKD